MSEFIRIFPNLVLRSEHVLKIEKDNVLRCINVVHFDPQVGCKLAESKCTFGVQTALDNWYNGLLKQIGCK